MINIDLETVKGFIKQELNLADMPVNETFGNLGFQDWQLNRIQALMARLFNRNLRPMWGDTLISYTERLLNFSSKPIKA